MTAPTPPLSPAAQAIDTALAACIQLQGEIIRARLLAAAALIAAADQVVPVEFHPEVYEDCCQYSNVQTRSGIRSKLLSLAAELKQS